jgi:hypothetical protein
MPCEIRILYFDRGYRTDPRRENCAGVCTVSDDVGREL